jgi:hypothetical protein
MSFWPGANIRGIKRAEVIAEMNRIQGSLVLKGAVEEAGEIREDVFNMIPLPEMAENAATRNIERFSLEPSWTEALKILYGV